MNDRLETDTDNDGTNGFFDPTPGVGNDLDKGAYVVGFNVGGPAVASQQGLGGVALRGDADPLISYCGDGATRVPGQDLVTNPNGANALPGAFKTYRDGKNWTVEVSGLKDGAYVVVLHTQETYWNAAGQRKFDLLIDGVTVANDLDPFVAGGGGDKIVSIEALVQVTDGSFTVTLDAQGADAIDNAALNAITVYQSAGDPNGGLDDGNEAPVAGVITPKSATEDAAFSFNAASAFSDPDGDALTFTATGLPAGLSISAAGVISGAPTVDGTFTVSVTASDGTLSDSASFALTVAAAPPPTTQAAFPGPTPGFTAGALTVDASNYDTGGQGVAWNDNSGRDNTTQAQRANTDVELVGAEQDIGHVLPGEWVECTVNVPSAGSYSLSLNAKTPIGGNTIAVSLGGATPLATFALADSNGAGTSFTGKTFGQTGSIDVELAAGVQTLRFTFGGAPAANGYLLDFRSFTLEQNAPVVAPDPDVVGEVGTVTFSQTSGASWQTVAFAEALDDPSVVMGPLSFNSAQSGTMRVRNVTDLGFQFQLDEWDYLDGAHISETVTWMAVEKGAHTLANGAVIEAGSALGGTSQSGVSFGSDFDAAPVVLGQAVTVNGPEAIATRLDEVTADGFLFQFQEQESADGVHAQETLDWIAIEAANLGGFVAGVTDDVVRHLNSSIALGGGFGSAPAFLAAMQTRDGLDPATVRLASLSSSAATVFVQEEQSADAETSHTTEVVGYFATTAGLLLA